LQIDDVAESSIPERTAGRKFGPDAAPTLGASKKAAGRSGKGERGPKQPIRERGGGRFFGDDGEDTIDDDLDSENFASRVEESEPE
jgi:hypothetical protein